MQIHPTSKNDLSKLDHNKYNKRDQDFSGLVFYSTPKGVFVSGWIYKAGKIINKISAGGTVTFQQVQSVKTESQKTLHGSCIYWYQFSYAGGELVGIYYLGTTCSTGLDEPVEFEPTGPGGGSGSGGGVHPTTVRNLGFG